MKSHKIAQIGMLVALAMVFSYLEFLVPVSLGIPGIKLGLSNLVTVFALYLLGIPTAFGISFVRIVLCGITFGSLSTMLYSMAGGMLSFLVMVLLKKTKKFSVYGVSIAGGVGHNVGQLLVAACVLQTGVLIYYFPFLLLAGTVAGAAIGLMGGIIIKRLSSQGDINNKL
ncbi:MAG: Gx transporter family protein [Lachnospiraceae bacterium]|nr:Gx transporter family protein [Lachnospiraceae bacterium]